TPVESPESNGMAEAFVKTFKRDYVRVNPIPNAAAALTLIDRWMEDYNTVHPHSRLGYRSPREYILSQPAACPVQWGQLQAEISQRALLNLDKIKNEYEPLLKRLDEV